MKKRLALILTFAIVAAVLADEAINSSSTGLHIGTRAVDRIGFWGVTPAAQQTIAALTENSSTIGGSNDGNLPDLTATGATVTGTLTGTVDGALANVADIALSTSDMYSDSAVNSAVNAAILDVNLQLKELQTALNEITADNVALRASARENATQINLLRTKLLNVGIVAAP